MSQRTHRPLNNKGGVNEVMERVVIISSRENSTYKD